MSNHVAPGAKSLNAYICIKNCADAIEFYKKAFNAEEKYRLLMPDGAIGHAELEIEGSLLMMSEENLGWGTKSPLSLGGNPLTLSLYVKDVDKSYQQALAAGAKSVMKITDEFYGDRVGQVIDPYGYKWMIATHKETVSVEEMQKRLTEMCS